MWKTFLTYGRFLTSRIANLLLIIRFLLESKINSLRLVDEEASHTIYSISAQCPHWGQFGHEAHGASSVHRIIEFQT